MAAKVKKKTLDKADLVDGSAFAMVKDAWLSVAEGKGRSDSEIAKAVYKKASVAARYRAQADHGHMLTTHQKMAAVRDLLCGTLMEPEIFVAFIAQARQDPMALAKITTAVMPKELNVEVKELQGVIMVPVRSANADDWQAAATAQLGQVVEGQSLPWNESR